MIKITKQLLHPRTPKQPQQINEIFPLRKYEVQILKLYFYSNLNNANIYTVISHF